MRRTIASILAVLLACLGLAACDSPGATSSDLGTLLDTFRDQTEQTPAPTPSPTDGNTAVGEWSADKYPDYYTVTGHADFTGANIPPAGTIEYSRPDSLNRSGRAIGVITKQLRDTGSGRDRDMPDTITGWPDRNPKVTISLGNGKTYKGYLFNKSHLIAKSLGGEDSARNMITGTRTQNVGKNQPAGGMAYTETLARDWLDRHPDGTVTYMATPNYTGSELLPRTVTVDIRTSDGSIDQHVIVFNTANGHQIDYQHGGVI